MGKERNGFAILQFIRVLGKGRSVRNADERMNCWIERESKQHPRRRVPPKCRNRGPEENLGG